MRQLKPSPSNIRCSWRELLGFHAHSWGRGNYLPHGDLALLQGPDPPPLEGGGMAQPSEKIRRSHYVTQPSLTLLGTLVPLLCQLLFLSQLVSESCLDLGARTQTEKCEGPQEDRGLILHF